MRYNFYVLSFFFFCLAACPLAAQVDDAEEENHTYRRMEIPDGYFQKADVSEISYGKGLLSISPSSQWVFWPTDVDDELDGYFSAGVSLCANYLMKLDVFRNVYVRAGGSVAARWPYRLDIPVSGNPTEYLHGFCKKPDVFGGLEIGVEFGGTVFRMAPLAEFGLAFSYNGWMPSGIDTSYRKTLFVAAAMELNWNISGPVRIFILPKLYYSGGKLTGSDMRFAPSVDMGVCFNLGRKG